MESKLVCDNISCLYNRDKQCTLERIHVDHIGFCMTLEELPDHLKEASQMQATQEKKTKVEDRKKRKLKIYFASGWFTENQKATYTTIKKLFDQLDVSTDYEIFYPKEQSKEFQGSLDDPETRTKIFKRNWTGILECNLMVCSTEDKDTGSIFEAGQAWCIRKPIVYVNLHLGDAPFNLMLTESCIAVARTIQDLATILGRIAVYGLNDPQLKEFRTQKTAE